MKNIDFAGMSREQVEEFAVETATEAEVLRHKVQHYEEQLRLLLHARFGAKSEKTKEHTDSDQLSLFDEAELLADPSAKEPELTDVKSVVNAKKKKQKGAKEALIKPLPKETVVYQLSPEEAICSTCGETLHKVRKEIRKELEIVPATVRVKVMERYVYSCHHCEEKREGTSPLGEPAPQLLLQGSLLSPSLAAFIICRKYENRDPLNKIEQDFALHGLKLSKQTLANWMMRLSEDYISLLYGRMKQELLLMPILHGDETPVQVLNEPGKTAVQKSYMWVFCSGKDQRDTRLYQYAPSRSQSVLQKFLEGYRGSYLICDGYGAYNGLPPGVFRVGCMAHVRRYFHDAEKLLPKGCKIRKSEPSRKGLRYCNLLMKMDAHIKQLPEKDRLAYKHRRVTPMLEQFFAWAEKESTKVLAQSSIGKALRYVVNQQESLRNYLRDGNLEMTNNRAERAVRPFVMGRKNWLFCNTPRGADASAAMYSLVETAKANKLKPFEYISWALDQMRKGCYLNDAFLDSLLPWSKEVPESCRILETNEE